MSFDINGVELEKRQCCVCYQGKDLPVLSKETKNRLSNYTFSTQERREYIQDILGNDSNFQIWYGNVYTNSKTYCIALFSSIYSKDQIGEAFDMAWETVITTAHDRANHCEDCIRTAILIDILLQLEVKEPVDQARNLAESNLRRNHILNLLSPQIV